MSRRYSYTAKTDHGSVEASNCGITSLRQHVTHLSIHTDDPISHEDMLSIVDAVADILFPGTKKLVPVQAPAQVPEIWKKLDTLIPIWNRASVPARRFLEEQGYRHVGELVTLHQKELPAKGWKRHRIQQVSSSLRRMDLSFNMGIEQLKGWVRPD